MITSLGVAYDWLIREPKQGPWRARIAMDPSDGLAVGASIDLLSGAWAGTIDSLAVRGAVAYVSIIGGAGKLAELTIPRHYQGGADARSVLADLCGDAGETAGETPEGASLSAWRTRGLPLAAELDRLARAISGRQWRIDPAGEVSLGQREAPEQADSLTVPISAPGDYQLYEIGSPEPLLDIATHDLAIYQRRIGGTPSVALYPNRSLVPRFDPQVVAGIVTGQAGAKVNVTLDDGTSLTDLPLFVVPGFEPSGITGQRCLVLDIGDDPRNTVALCGIDGTVQEIVMGGQHGKVLRDGDKISIVGLISAAPGAPVTATPAGTLITLDPTVSIAPGEPGVGHSKVRA